MNVQDKNKRRAALYRPLAKQGLQGFFDTAHGDQLNIDLRTQTFERGLGEQEALETKFGGLCDALTDASDGADFAAQTYLAGHCNRTIDGNIHIARQNGGDDAQIYGGVGDAQAAGDIEKYVLSPPI